jgi:uncharacterized membrane protein
MLKSDNRSQKITQTASIAAIYAILTYVSASMGLAYSGMQFRISEALTILPIFTPSAIPGLAIGCLIANIGSPYGIIDLILGPFSSFLAAKLTRKLRHFRVRGIPILAPLPSIIINVLVVGSLVTCMLPEGFTLISLLASMINIGLSELAICYGIGLPLAVLLEKTNIIKTLSVS